ncbi:MAG: iron-containing alcohol dehydrogenase [Clostridiales bacterium]|nr:iron-containing alcohol dehydrogenase [Clostridiales bacterium]
MQNKRIISEEQYPIDIGRSTAKSLVTEYIVRTKDLQCPLIVTDREVGGCHLEEFQKAFEEHEIPVSHVIVDGNPSSKTLDMLTQVYERISDLNCSCIIALGGGGVLDIAMFAASTYGNGKEIILVPTTLLAMLESVSATHATLHFQSQKDLIRVPTKIPSYAVIDVSYLKTLPRRYLANGIAQIIRYGLIDSPALIHTLASAKDLTVLIEEGLRTGRAIRKTKPELLSFGRDIADAIECHFRFMKYTHGEAMALSLLALCPSAALHRLYERLGLPVTLTEVTKDALLKRITKTLEKQGRTVELIRIGPEKKPVIQKVALEAAIRYYDSALDEICHKAGE